MAVIGLVGIIFRVLFAGAAALGAGGGAGWCFREQAPNMPAAPINTAITRKRFMKETSCHWRRFMLLLLLSPDWAGRVE